MASEISKDSKGLSEFEYRWMEEHCIGDDTGENISEKNRTYCEASILYWMWKNFDKLGNPDYIGFLQYRRLFILNDNYTRLNSRGNIHNLIVEQYFEDNSQEKIGLNQKNLEDTLAKYDGIFCVNNTNQTVQDYKENHHSQDVKYWNKAIDIIKNDWPQYYEAAMKYNNGTLHAWSNCFVMKKEDFLEYCPFLFDVLSKIDNFASLDYKNMSIEQMRVPAYVSETMLGIFYTYLVDKGKKFKSTHLLYIKKPFETFEEKLDMDKKTIDKIKDNAVSVFLIADSNYLKYSAATIKSIVINASPGDFYDIVILEDGTIQQSEKKLMLIDLPSNVSIRFFNSSFYIRKYGLPSFWKKRLNIMPYLKGFVSEIFLNYERILFLDSDTIVLNDLAELYSLNLQGNYVGAVEDFIVTENKADFWKRKREYIISLNKMKNPRKYFNSGVMLFDLVKIRADKNFINSFILESKFKHPWRCNHDQDSLNFILENRVMLLPQKYNFQCALLNNYETLPDKVISMVEATRKNIAIIHYDGDKTKPWKVKGSSYESYIWWKYARMTPYYEEILYFNMGTNILNETRKLFLDTPYPTPGKNEFQQEALQLKKMLQKTVELPTYRRKLQRIRWKAHFSWGKRKQRYLKRKEQLKKEINAIEKFLKNK